MYTEEHLEDAFHTPDLSIYDEDDGSISLDSHVKDQRKRAEIVKMLDKDYYKIYKNVDGLMTKIEAYSTPVLTNSRIRDAVTGSRMEHRSGSRYQDLYFIMADSTGNCRTDKNTDPRKLFFQNPEQCERHMRISIPANAKEAWQDKYLAARALYYR